MKKHTLDIATQEFYSGLADLSQIYALTCTQTDLNNDEEEGSLELG